jgi:hypothetical protein
MMRAACAQAVWRLEGLEAGWDELCRQLGEIGFADEAAVLAQRFEAWGRDHRRYARLESLGRFLRYELRQMRVRAPDGHPFDVSVYAREVSACALVQAEVAWWERFTEDAKYPPESSVGPGTW